MIRCVNCYCALTKEQDTCPECGAPQTVKPQRVLRVVLGVVRVLLILSLIPLATSFAFQNRPRLLACILLTSALLLLLRSMRDVTRLPAKPKALGTSHKQVPAWIAARRAAVAGEGEPRS